MLAGGLMQPLEAAPAAVRAAEAGPAASSSGAILTAEAGRVLELTARELDLVGSDARTLSLMRWSGQDFVPIPFQWDPLGEADLVWFADSGLQRDRPAHQLAPADLLLMREADAGPPAPPTARPEPGRLLRTLELDAGRFAYLVQDHPARSTVTHVRHDPVSGHTETDFYTLQTNPANELDWRGLGYHSYRGEGSVIESLQLRMSAGVLTRFSRVQLDQDNLRPRVVGIRLGPIRSVMHLETRVVIAGIPVMTLQMQALRYPGHYEAHTHARVPTLYRHSLRVPEVTVALAGAAQYGARVRTASGGERVARVDGVMGEDDLALKRAGLNLRDNWILFDSGQDFILLAELDVPPTLEMPLDLVYEDDAGRGRLPWVGYALNGWPPSQELRFAVRMLFDRSVPEGDPAAWARQRLSRPPVRILR